MAAERLLYFPVYVDEALSDERYQGWSCEERGAWFHLILMCYREGSIPASQDVLRRMLHLDAPAMSLVWQAIGDRFAASPDAPDRLTSPRVERERQKALRLMGVRSEAGEKGASARWDKRNKVHSKRIANASGRNAVPMANDTKQSRAEESRSDQKQQHGGLPLKSELVGGQNPGISALRLRLAEEGLDLTWPAHDKRADVEAAVVRCGVDACVTACLVDAEGMKQAPKSLGIFAPTLDRLRPRPVIIPADSTPWWSRATAETLARYEREREEIDAELRGAPPGCVGARCPDDVRALIARYETEARQ